MSVLETTPPAFTPDEVAAIARELFGVEGDVVDLGSERDQTFRVGDAVVKVSNSGEDAAVLDLERDAIAHARAVDPGLPLARPLAERRDWRGHHVRLFELLHGRKGGAELDDAAVRAYTQTHGRLNLALRSFFHPAAGRELLWDLRQTPGLRPLLRSIEDAARRSWVERVVDRFEAHVLPRWPRLRAQVVHGDLNLDNVLLDDRDRVCGIVDFGDCGWSAQAADLAIAIASLMRGRPLHDAFRVGRIAIDGYAGLVPLEPLELELLGDLVAARLAMIVAISAWRVRRYPANAGYIQAWDDDSWGLLEAFDELGPETVARELGAPRPPVPTKELERRRADAVGAVLTRLSYARPVHVVRGEGAWLFEADGRRLLDGYNNVPVVGHCHPRVTEAVVRQTRTLNTHARYLYEPLVELAERLLATMPPGSGLDTVMLVNSGSEANDIARRIARDVTGRAGALVTHHAYHGVTAATMDLSPEEWPEGYTAPHVARIPPRWTAADLDRAFGESDVGVAFVDGALTSDGIFVPPPGALAELVRRTHEAGALYVADEVQAGFGRTGEHLWSFAAARITPDLVTLGKPMGNGYPVAALVTRAELAECFPYAGRTFSTFGGNPVAAAAALAVLDVIEDERLVEHAARVGAYLRERLDALEPGSRSEPGSRGWLDVRGAGLLLGVQLESPERARAVVDGLREDGVLIGRTGFSDDVLKIRPPLVFAEEHADLLVAALARAARVNQ